MININYNLFTEEYGDEVLGFTDTSIIVPSGELDKIEDYKRIVKKKIYSYMNDAISHYGYKADKQTYDLVKLSDAPLTIRTIAKENELNMNTPIIEDPILEIDRILSSGELPSEVIPTISKSIRPTVLRCIRASVRRRWLNKVLAMARDKVDRLDYSYTPYPSMPSVDDWRE